MDLVAKFQSKQKTIKGQTQDHLFDEIEVMNKLNHPFILKLHGVGQNRDTICMFLEYIKNGDLMKYLYKSPNKKI